MPAVTVVGLGLIGGSIGMALKRRGWSVRYVDPAVSLESARAAGAADERLETASGELVVIATPLDAAVALMPRIHAEMITTTCSVMQPFAASSTREVGALIAGHPLAGAERSGLEAARHDLFEGRVWFLERDQPGVRTMVDATGARVVIVNAAEHDEAMALTSHLPQVISTALASLIEQKGIDPVFYGSGLRTLLRLAASPYDMWGPVLDANSSNVAKALDDLLRVAEQLDERDFDRAHRWSGSA